LRRFIVELGAGLIASQFEALGPASEGTVLERRTAS
jgi:hypothetical protein